MKMIIALLFIISCGKDINSSKKDYRDEDFDSIPNFLEQGDERNYALYRLPETIDVGQMRLILSQEDIPHDFYENTKILARYEWVSHTSHQKEIEAVSLLPHYLELVLRDQGKNLPLKGLVLNEQLQERLSTKSAYFELKLKTHSPLQQFKVIKDYSNRELYFINQDTNQFLLNLKKEVQEMNLISMIQNPNPLNENKWILKKESPTFFKMIFSSEENLQNDFKRKYHYKKLSLKRMNGKSDALSINSPLLLKISGQKTMQMKMSKKEYIDPGYLPNERQRGGCSFYRHYAQIRGKTNLAAIEIYKELKHYAEFAQMNLVQWNYLSGEKLTLRMNQLATGYFDVGILDARCPQGIGPKLRRAQVNEELELELIIETYTRRP